MNSRLNVLCLGAALALTAFMTKPVMADEWTRADSWEGASGR
jgi:hypothetical protein